MGQEIPATPQNKASQDCTHNSWGSNSLYTTSIHVAPMLSCCLYNSVAQSDEGCRKDLFKTSQKKGVGYLLLITAFQYFPLGSVRSVQRKMPLHVTSVMTALCNGSPLQSPHIIFYPQKQKLSTRSTRRKKVLSRCTWCVFMLRM